MKTAILVFSALASPFEPEDGLPRHGRTDTRAPWMAPFGSKDRFGRFSRTRATTGPVKTRSSSNRSVRACNQFCLMPRTPFTLNARWIRLFESGW